MSMKMYRYTLIGALIISMAVFVYFLIRYQSMSQETEIGIENTQDAFLTAKEDGSEAVFSVPSQVISEDTEWIVVNQYPDGTLEQNGEFCEFFPRKEDCLGLDRTQLSEQIFQHMLSPTKEELAAGLLRIEIIVFSGEQVIIQRVYEKEIRDFFYLAVVDDYLVVLSEDKQTIFLNTGIKVSDLSEEHREEILNIKVLYGQEELFHFLETLTS